MHASLTFFTIVLFDPAAVEVNWIIGFAHAAALWVIVAAVLRLQNLPRPERGVPPIEIYKQKGASS